MSLCAASTLRHSKRLAEALNNATIENISKLDYESYQKIVLGEGGRRNYTTNAQRNPTMAFVPYGFVLIQV